MTFDEAMKLALALYKSGSAVVFKDKNGNVIHGEEELASVGSVDCGVIPGIDIGEWNANRDQWQGILDAARLGRLKLAPFHKENLLVRRSNISQVSTVLAVENFPSVLQSVG